MPASSRSDDAHDAVLSAPNYFTFHHFQPARRHRSMIFDYDVAHDAPAAFATLYAYISYYFGCRRPASFITAISYYQLFHAEQNIAK